MRLGFRFPPTGPLFVQAQAKPSPPSQPIFPFIRSTGNTSRTDLRQAQNEYESLSYALRAADEEGTSAKEKSELEAKAKGARTVLLAAAARLARVEEHAQGVSQKGRVHQRVADRLLELCQLNLGCYIKSAYVLASAVQCIHTHTHGLVPYAGASLEDTPSINYIFIYD